MNTSYLEERRARAARAWELKDEIVLVGAGEFVPIPGSGDQVYPFLPHAEFRYLADVDRAGSVLAFDPREGWRLFAPVVTDAEKVWMGDTPAVGEPRAGLADWLGARAGRPLARLGCPVADTIPDAGLSERLRARLKDVRRAKDAVEMDRIRAAVRATARGFHALPDIIHPGATERTVQIELEAEFFRAGGERAAYDTIVCSGPNAAVLHFHPGPRVIEDEDVVLVDAGTEIGGYCADVTRTFAATGKFTPERQAVYDVVLAAQTAAVDGCTAGRSYRDVHLAACVDLARGLVDLGLLRGDPEGLVERDAHTLFFPHGIGHMVGLGVRDGDSAPARAKSDRATLKYLRLDLALEPGYVVTIEPGIYFIPALLDNERLRAEHRDAVDWSQVEKFRKVGGVRIEDNVLVTLDGPENLTASIEK